MKYIIITNSFKKNLRKLRKYFSEQDIINDIKNFSSRGLRKNETFLKSVVLYEKKLSIAKLRIIVRIVKGRYLLGILENQKKIEYIPIIVDLKKSKYGQNLSFNANKETFQKIHQAIKNSLSDHKNFTKNNPTMDIYKI